MRTVKPATPAQDFALHAALGHLRAARDALASADCPKTLARVRAAIKSAEGAERHMIRRTSPHVMELQSAGPSTPHAFGEPRGSGIAFDDIWRGNTRHD